MSQTVLASRRIGDLVTEDFRRAAVLKRHEIDFCCGGGITLEAACRRSGVEIDDMIRELDAATTGREAASSLRFEAWEPAFLATYIVNQHHTYVREQLPVIAALTQKVASVHGTHRPELVAIAALFEEVAGEMRAHMASEEDVVFPRIRAVEEDGSGQADLRGLIAEMEAEHDRAGSLMREIRHLADGYRAPDGACNSYRAAFALLEEFEADLHLHVHLENNVLFPKAIGEQESREPRGDA